MVSMKSKVAINNERGTSLVEVLATLIVLGIISATAIPNFSAWRTNYEIRTESENVRMQLLLARMTAIKNNNNVVVTFTSTGPQHSISILNDTNSDGIQNGGETLNNYDLDKNMRFGFYGPSIKDMDNTTRSQAVVMGASDKVILDGRGQADLSGVLFLIHANDLNENNNRLRGINILQATGAAELWKYNSALTPVPWE
jgi:Tfp pilus assembly protein FimT